MHEGALSAVLLFLANQSPSVTLILVLSPIGFSLIMTTIIVVMGIHGERRYGALVETYGKDVAKLGGYYESNVTLVESWKAIAEGFQSTVVLNTQTIQRVCDLVEKNQYCPHVRINKTAKGPQD